MNREIPQWITKRDIKDYNCGLILPCVYCGKNFDEEESDNLFFCSDTCKIKFIVQTLSENNKRLIKCG